MEAKRNQDRWMGYEMIPIAMGNPEDYTGHWRNIPVAYDSVHLPAPEGENVDKYEKLRSSMTLDDVRTIFNQPSLWKFRVKEGDDPDYDYFTVVNSDHLYKEVVVQSVINNTVRAVIKYRISPSDNIIYAEIIYGSKKYFDILAECSSPAFVIWNLVNYIMMNKPVRMIESSYRHNIHETKAIRRKGKKTKSRKNKVVVEKTLYIADDAIDEVIKNIKRHHNITCPCWGVMGHWRTYKNGRRVWIKPYRKGKSRDSYQTKEYKI